MLNHSTIILKSYNSVVYPLPKGLLRKKDFKHIKENEIETHIMIPQSHIKKKHVTMNSNGASS